jgi:hypothetical protein
MHVSYGSSKMSPVVVYRKHDVMQCFQNMVANLAFDNSNMTIFCMLLLSKARLATTF